MQTVEARQAEIQSLKSQIKELKSMIASVVTKSTDSKKEFMKLPSQVPLSPGSRQNAEMPALKKQLKRLKLKADNKMLEQQSEVAVSAMEAKPASKPLAVREPQKQSGLNERPLRRHQ